jgi:hypothetical protein
METISISAWLYETLAGNAVGVGDRVHEGAAPEGTTYPLIVFDLYSGSDTMGVGPARILVDSRWMIKAVDRSQSFTNLKTIVDAIDNLLHGATPYANGVLGAVREQPVQFVEEIDGVQYRYLGGIYRILAN